MSHIPQSIKDKIVSKVSKELSRGLNKIEHNNETALHYEKATKTYYLIKDGLKIITHRQWYQLGSPAYIVSGSHEGCESTRKTKLSSDSQEK
jgi:hypothetical protein